MVVLDFSEAVVEVEELVPLEEEEEEEGEGALIIQEQHNNNRK